MTIRPVKVGSAGQLTPSQHRLREPGWHLPSKPLREDRAAPRVYSPSGEPTARRISGVPSGYTLPSLAQPFHSRSEVLAAQPRGSGLAPPPQDNREGLLQDKAWPEWRPPRKQGVRAPGPPPLRDGGDLVAAMQGMGLTRGALAQKFIDFVQAAAILETRAAGTLIRVDFTVYALVAWRGKGGTVVHEWPQGAAEPTSPHVFFCCVPSSMGLGGWAGPGLLSGPLRRPGTAGPQAGSTHQACRYTGTPRSGPSRWHHSDMGLRCTH